MSVLAIGKVELGEHMADVGLDRALAEIQALGDADVCKPLGHQLEHFALAVRQIGQRVVTASSRDEARHDLRIESRSALGDPFCRREELADLEDAILQQVSETAVRHKLDGMRRLDVLGEYEHAELRKPPPDLARGPCPLVGEGRRHTDVDDDEVGGLRVDRREQPVGVADQRYDLVAAILEEAGCRPRDILVGRLLALFGLSSTIALALGVLMVVGSRPQRTGDVFLALALTLLVSTSVGWLTAAVIPRELEGTLLLIGIVGLQVSIPVSGDANLVVPYYGPLRLTDYDRSAIGPGGPVVHSLAWSALIAVIALVLWRRHVRIHS